MFSIKGLDKAIIFFALYINAKYVAERHLSGLVIRPEIKTLDDVRELFSKVNEQSLWFGLVNGRFLEINLTGDHIYTGLYNKANGISAEDVIRNAYSQHLDELDDATLARLTRP